MAVLSKKSSTAANRVWEDKYQEINWAGGAKVYDSDDDSEDGEESPVVTGDRLLVLQFFNEASLGELAAVGGCSKKKAEAVLQLRPFADWGDIVSSLAHQLVNLGSCGLLKQAN